MMQEYNKDISKQEKTPEQVSNWVNGNEIKEIYDELKRNADLLYKKKTLTPSDLQQIQSYIIISLLAGWHIYTTEAQQGLCTYGHKRYRQK